MPAIHHPERDRRHPVIGNADITAWARSTSAAIRPEVKGVSRAAARAVDPKRIRPLIATSATHNPTEIVLPGSTKTGKPEIGDGIIAANVENSLRISADFWRRFRR